MNQIYQYIAAANPDACVQVFEKYGQTLEGVETTSDLAICMEKLVGISGQNAFYDFLDLHPDKEVILEVYASKMPVQSSGEHKCGCKGKESSKVDAYLTQSNSNNGFSLQQGNTFLIAAAMILAVAIIVKSN